MGIRIEIELDEEHSLLFKQCVRKLLDNTFIVQDKDKERKLYTFLADASNRQAVSEYLSAIGFDVSIYKDEGFAMLCVNDNDTDTVGLKTANLISFTKNEKHLFILLWSEYQKCYGHLENGEVYITKGDLIDEMKEFGIGMNPGQLNNAMRLFRKHSLLNFDGKWECTGENLPIKLYPTLCYAMNRAAFTQTAEEFLEGQQNGNYEEDEDNENEWEDSDGNLDE